MASQHKPATGHMFFPFVEAPDEWGHVFVTRIGKATTNIDQALRTLRRLKRGEIRNEHNEIVALKDPKYGTRLLSDVATTPVPLPFSGASV
jgi:hypothetical protein